MKGLQLPVKTTSLRRRALKWRPSSLVELVFTGGCSDLRVAFFIMVKKHITSISSFCVANKNWLLWVLYIAVLFFVFISTSILFSSPTNILPSPKPITDTPSTNTEQLYLVTDVIDGDTIDVLIDGTTWRLRLIGIDTPETKDPRKPVQCFGKEASARATELLLNNKVMLEMDKSQGELGKYDRLLRYVYLENGTSYNEQMITDGFAREYTYDTPYKYQEEYRQAQEHAEESSNGLWSPDTCDGKVNLINP